MCPCKRIKPIELKEVTMNKGNMSAGEKEAWLDWARRAFPDQKEGLPEAIEQVTTFIVTGTADSQEEADAGEKVHPGMRSVILDSQAQTGRSRKLGNLRQGFRLGDLLTAALRDGVGCGGAVFLPIAGLGAGFCILLALSFIRDFVKLLTIELGEEEVRVLHIVFALVVQVDTTIYGGSRDLVTIHRHVNRFRIRDGLSSKTPKEVERSLERLEKLGCVEHRNGLWRCRERVEWR